MPSPSSSRLNSIILHIILPNMTNKKTLALILCTLVIASISILPSHCRTLHPNGDKLIKGTCSKTPDPDQCVKYIKADPRSPDVKDVPGLGITMAEVFQLKGRDLRDLVYAMLTVGDRPDIMDALRACLGSYNFILKTDIELAINAFKNGKPKLAEDSANVAANGVVSCENGFNGKSPITYENNVTHGIAILLAAIARELE